MTNNFDSRQFMDFNFYEGWREIVQFYKDTLGMDVTPQKVYVLEILDLREQLTMKELSKKMNLDSSAVSTLISRMEKKELVKRTHGTKDRRTVFVQLTNNGVAERSLIRTKFSALQKNITQGISEEDILKLREIVSKIKANHKKLIEQS